VEKSMAAVEKSVENSASGLKCEFTKIKQNVTEQFCLWKTLKIRCEKKIKKVKIFLFESNFRSILRKIFRNLESET
jgi:hypothetical protein